MHHIDAIEISAGRYRVYHQDEVVCASSRTPLFDACRALGERGLSGQIGLRSLGSDVVRVTTTIEAGAGLSASEDGLRFVRFRPDDETSRRSRPARSPAGKRGPSGTRAAKNNIGRPGERQPEVLP